MKCVLTLITASLLSFFSLHGNENIYLSKDSIELVDEGILVYLPSGSILMVNSIQKDETGFYLRKEQRFEGPWYCIDCQTWNGSWDSTCRGCKRKRTPIDHQ